MRDAPLFSGLSSVEKARLRTLTTQFLQQKTITPVQGLVLTETMQVAIAAQACLLILRLGLNYYRRWVEVVIYPSAFVVERETADENGLVSSKKRTLLGESWSRGPVILSWDDVAADLAGKNPGHNVVLHEFAHKIDMLNGRANGMPPLHGNMVRKRWTEVFSASYDKLQQRLIHHRRHVIDRYGATAPEEFFAVATELFFTEPATLRGDHPRLYEQLVLFYRQSPLS